MCAKNKIVAEAQEPLPRDGVRAGVPPVPLLPWYGSGVLPVTRDGIPARRLKKISSTKFKILVKINPNCNVSSNIFILKFVLGFYPNYGAAAEYMRAAAANPYMHGMFESQKLCQNQKMTFVTRF